MVGGTEEPSPALPDTGTPTGTPRPGGRAVLGAPAVRRATTVIAVGPGSRVHAHPHEERRSTATACSHHHWPPDAVTRTAVISSSGSLPLQT